MSCVISKKERNNEYFMVDGRLHREDGPALITTLEDKIVGERWFFDGNRHRTNGPAVVVYYDDKLVVMEEWYLNNKRHRDDGPAVVEYFDSEFNNTRSLEKWYCNDALHRLDGPAITDYSIKGEPELELWYYHGIRRTRIYSNKK